MERAGFTTTRAVPLGAPPLDFPAPPQPRRCGLSDFIQKTVHFIERLTGLDRRGVAALGHERPYLVESVAVGEHRQQRGLARRDGGHVGIGQLAFRGFDAEPAAVRLQLDAPGAELSEEVRDHSRQTSLTTIGRVSESADGINGSVRIAAVFAGETLCDSRWPAVRAATGIPPSGARVFTGDSWSPVFPLRYVFTDGGGAFNG